MNARLLALLVAVLCVLGATWFVREELRHALPEAKSETAPARVAGRDRTEEKVAAPASLDGTERSAVAPEEAKSRGGDEEEESDPPTPEHPGPGQALLHVEVVALETGRPLVGAHLAMSPTDYDVE